jgi:hypothetical protein
LESGPCFDEQLLHILEAFARLRRQVILTDHAAVRVQRGLSEMNSTPTTATALVPRWGWLVVLGIVQIIAGWIAIAVPIVGWGWLFAGGLGSIVVGVVLLIGWPATALWAIGLLLGINIIFTGAMHVVLALSSRTGTSANPLYGSLRSRMSR